MVEGRRGIAGVHGDKQLCVVSELVIGNAARLDEFTDWCDVRREEQRSEYGPMRHSIQARRRAGRVSAEIDVLLSLGQV